jgi:hypothetical protein
MPGASHAGRAARRITTTMITIAGSVHRSFKFPGHLEAAFDYYADIRRTLNMLPHISIVRQYAADQFRMMYSTTELGVYRVRMLCDIQVELDREACVLRIQPMPNSLPVTVEAGVYSLTGQGFFASQSLFRNTGEHTQVEYRFRLSAELPVPFGIRFMPESVLNGIASSITQWRIEEIVDGFIQRSVETYRLSKTDDLNIAS